MNAKRSFYCWMLEVKNGSSSFQFTDNDRGGVVEPTAGSWR